MSDVTPDPSNPPAAPEAPPTPPATPPTPSAPVPASPPPPAAQTVVDGTVTEEVVKLRQERDNLSKTVKDRESEVARLQDENRTLKTIPKADDDDPFGAYD